jgi:prepilin-type N-terminal cleavage/methylation domain-containing protein
LVKKNNRGLSLVEIIVVVAILSVIIGTVSIGFGLVSTKSATECAKNIQISLERCRINTMGKKQGCIAIYKKTDGIYIVEAYDYGATTPTLDSIDKTNEKRIGKKDVNVYMGAGPYDPTTTYSAMDTGYIIEFNRSDGSVKSISGTSYLFIFNKGSRTEVVSIDKLTGRVTLTKG